MQTSKGNNVLSLEDLSLLERALEQGEHFPEEVQRHYAYSRGYYDIGWFSDFHFSQWKKKGEKYIKTPAFHHEIWGMLKNTQEDLTVIVARGHGKTTAILIYIVWRLVYFGGWNILYIASLNLGERGIGIIRRELETNETLRFVFGDLVPRNASSQDKKLLKWRQKELELLNGSYVSTATKGQPARGKRPNEILMDDPQDNKDVRNPAIAKKFEEWVFTSLYNMLLPGGRLAVIGTIVGNFCLVKRLRDEYRWHTVEYQACDSEFGNILWADMWSEESLRERRDGKIIKNPDGTTTTKKGIGTAYFNQEYRNIPINVEDRIIREEWIRYYSGAPPAGKTAIVIDPAVTVKQRSDYTGLCVLRYGCEDGKIYIMWSKGVKVPPRELEALIVSMNERIKPDIILKESNIEVKLLDDLKARGLPIIGVRTNKDKHTRLLEVSGLIETGMVLFSRQYSEKLVEQLVNYPDVDHDDEMDACIIGTKHAIVGETNNEISFSFF